MFQKIKLSDDTIAYIEVDEIQYKDQIPQYVDGVENTSLLSNTVEKVIEGSREIASDLFEDGLDKMGSSIALFNSKLLTKITSSFEESAKPAELSLEYGLDFVGELDIKFAKSSMKSSIKISLTWKF